MFLLQTIEYIESRKGNSRLEKGLPCFEPITYSSPTVLSFLGKMLVLYYVLQNPCVLCIQEVHIKLFQSLMLDSKI